MARCVWRASGFAIRCIRSFRPRGGDFCYGTVDFEVIKQDLRQIREMGFPGVVVGMLDEEGHIDLPRMRK